MSLIATSKNLKLYKKMIDQIIHEDLDLKTGNLKPVVKKFIALRRQILAVAAKHPTPFYLFDDQSLKNSLNAFKTAFRTSIPDSEYYYALKVNHHPLVVKRVIKSGFGLDVSSGRELEIALKNRVKKIIFTGPGKTEEELALALRHTDKVIINIDSFGELEKISKLLKNSKITLRAGVRIYTRSQGAWKKFGIPLSELKTFWHRAQKIKNLDLQGIHFHSSWNQDADPYCQIIRELSRYLKNNFSQTERGTIKFIDFGGGFRPYGSEGFYPWETSAGEIIRSAAEASGSNPKFSRRYYLTEADTLDDYAKGIGRAIDQYLRPIVNCRYFSEPGRIICDQSLHLVLKIIDLKKPGQAIADGGINLVGWERFEHDYFPLINLTRPSLKEIKFNIFGSLCMPQDIWGTYCFGKDVRENDLILVPNQGALTYSLAQNFIKPIAKTYRLR